MAIGDLTVTEYDHAEHEATLRAPLLVRLSFQPVFFQHDGFPTRIEQEFQLPKFIDKPSAVQIGRNGSVRAIVSSRPGPTEMISTGTSSNDSTRSTYARALSGSDS